MEKYEEVTFTRNQINKLIDVVDNEVLKKKIKIQEVSSGKIKANEDICNDLIDILKEEQGELEVILEILKQAWRKH